MDFQLPELGEGIYEAEFVRWLVNVGDRVKRSQSLMEVLTDKATMEVPAPFAGTITALKAEPGQQLKVGATMLTYTPSEAGEPAPAAPEPASQPQPAPRRAAVMTAPAARRVTATPGNGTPTGTVPIKAAPSVRYLARKLGIVLEQVHGSGPDGRILIDDLAPHLRDPATATSDSREPKADYGTPGTRLKFHGLRRKIAERMVQSKRTIPHYSYIDECDVTELVKLRESLRDVSAQRGVKVTYLAFFVKAVVAALKEVPIVNASLDEEAGEIVLHDRYDVGIAVAAPAGLIVPVVRQADRLELFDLAHEIERLSADARIGKAKLEDLRGSTFTITSIGNIGGLISTPVINPPEVGILGIGKIVKRPVYDDAGALRSADLVYLSFSFDHRVLDGAVGAAFGNAVIRHLRNPVALLVSGT